MGALLSLLIPMVPSLIAGVESIFKKPGSGQTKMDAVLTALRGILEKFVSVQQPAPAPGTPVPPLTVPTDAALESMIETVLQQMKLTGQLGAPPIVASVPAVITPGSGFALDAGGFVGDIFASLGKRVVQK